jgi:hypothetical protein
VWNARIEKWATPWGSEHLTPIARQVVGARNPRDSEHLIHCRGPANRIGKCLATIAYAQLIIENCLPAAVAPSSVMFHALVEDLSAEALKLSARFPSGSLQRTRLQDVVQVPRTDAADLQSVAEFIRAHYGWLANEQSKVT